ncbi:MAG: 1-(5-phosphoribosyl)-5-[(5-phosphoribosylamino)methylideneamino]imidazole-4-carboxamide isomerase, partial [Candidatus Omnitrophica bacterium]|nr:1-(5-phosphoribosyl)-5-[(5-phosphoribosylamino)methylideneamino]imidazole-4-carboxamide isomerase [Candidatus Omnitrophota bacterium]
MVIIPAIDLWEGKVVRLKKGDPAQSTVYSSDPLEIARKWARMGAKLLHLVDLSAALGKKDNLEVIKTIIAEKIIKVEI